MTGDNDLDVDRAEAVARLLRPRSVLMVGASGNATFLAGVVVANLRRFGYEGRLAGVNPKYDSIGGFLCYPSIADVPEDEDFDVAYLSVRKEAVVESITECGRRGIRAAVIISSGFAESGEEAGRQLQAELAATAQLYGMAICGPNCAGIANFTTDFVGYGTNNFLQLEEIIKGGVAVVTASGGLGNTIFSYLQAERIGCSHLISVGNEAVTSTAQYVEQLVEDPAVTMIVTYVESIRDPQRFADAVERANFLGKPVVMLKPGKSDVGRDAMKTHTAAVSGSRASYEGWCRRHGVILVDDIDELAECAVALSRVQTAGGNRVGLFSLPGGGLALVADHAADNGFELPPFTAETVSKLEPVIPPLAVIKNPLDPTAGFRDSPDMGNVLVILSEDDQLDLIIYFPLVSDAAISDKIVDRVLASRNRMRKPLVCIWTVGSTPELENGPWRRLRENDVALYTRTSNCFKALARQRERLLLLQARERDDVAVPPSTPAPTPAQPTAAATERALVDHLAANGARVPRSEIARSAEAAAAIVGRMGDAVAMKVVSPDIAHKTETGGVRLGVTGADSARAAYRDILATVEQRAPAAVVEGVQIQEMVPEGVELLLGVTTEPDLGPMVVVGAGGILTDLLDDRAISPAPVDRAEARRLVGRLRVSALLDGFRGEPPADVERLLDVVVALSEFAAHNASLALEVDLNPVVVERGPHGRVTIVDTLVFVGAAGSAP